MSITATRPPGARAPEVAAALRRALSEDRLRPYSSAAGGLPGALRLYRWNAAVSSAMFEVLGTVEVAVRNAVDEQLGISCTGGRWWEPAWWPGRRPPRPELADAAARARGRRDRHGAVVTGLGLAFWTDVLSDTHADLWEPCLRDGFPGLPADGRPELHAALVRLLALRNRIAHHEPIHREDLASLHADALDVLGAICPVTREWVSCTSRVLALLAQDPRERVVS